LTANQKDDNLLIENSFCSRAVRFPCVPSVFHFIFCLPACCVCGPLCPGRLLGLGIFNLRRSNFFAGGKTKKPHLDFYENLAYNQG